MGQLTMARIALTLSIVAVLLGGGALAVALTRNDNSGADKRLACLEQLLIDRYSKSQIEREYEEFSGNPDTAQTIVYCRES